MRKINDPFRMFAWLALGLMLYAASALIGTDRPAVQTVLYKLGHVTTLAWFGYQISRAALGRLNPHSPASLYIARAIVMAGVIIAGSLGL